MIQIHTTRNNRIILASLEESIHQAIDTSQDVKIPDGPIVIDKDLLQDIRNHLAYDAWDKANSSSEILLSKLDNLYPFLK